MDIRPGTMTGPAATCRTTGLCCGDASLTRVVGAGFVRSRFSGPRIAGRSARRGRAGGCAAPVGLFLGDRPFLEAAAADFRALHAGCVLLGVLHFLLVRKSGSACEGCEDKGENKLFHHFLHCWSLFAPPSKRGRPRRVPPPPHPKGPAPGRRKRSRQTGGDPRHRRAMRGAMLVRASRRGRARLPCGKQIRRSRHVETTARRRRGCHAGGVKERECEREPGERGSEAVKLDSVPINWFPVAGEQ